MTICARCHRPLRIASATGFGPVCSKKVSAQPVPAHERDLFGYDLDLAADGALFRVELRIAVMAAEARIAVRDGFRRARVELLGWEARA